MATRSGGLQASITTALLPVVAVALWACGDGAQKKGQVCQLAQGDLVISELMPAPDTDSEAPEWIEIWNASGDAVTLNRLTLEVEATAVKDHELQDAGTLDAGAYFVLGEKEADYVDYVYDGISLTNDGATVRLLCQDELVDEVAYGEAGGGVVESDHSLSLDGGLLPDEFLNNDGDYWCSGDVAYDDVNFGTPGMANASCGVATCSEGAADRDVVPPGPGDVVVSEVFADAATEGGDTGKEWIELYGAADHAVDLNALEVVVTNATSGSSETYPVASIACVTLQPGDYLVLGAQADPLLNGGVTVDVVVEGLSLTNDVPLSITLQRGNLVVDTALVPKSKPGKSVRLDDGLSTDGGDDQDGAYCDAGDTQTGLFAEVGSPGAPNGLCGVLTCRDGDSVRPVMPPGVGDLLVSEILAEPTADGAREWIELYVAGASAADLNGLTIRNSKPSTGSTQGQTLNVEDCISVQPGAYVVLAHEADPAHPSTLPVDAIVPGLAFYNDAPLQLELSRLGVVFDIANVPASVAGTATGVPSIDPAANDIDTAFCSSTVHGLFEEAGTPGQPNLCGAACVDDGVARLVTPPLPGEIVITELQTNPGPGADNGRDWVEVYLAGATSVDLNGLSVVNLNPTPTSKGWTLEADTCMRLDPGGYAVLGGINAVSQGVTALTTFGTSSDAMFFSSFSGVAVGCTINPAPASCSLLTLLDGETVLDVVSYPSQGSHDAESYQLDDGVLTAAGNDNGLWCTAATTGANYTGGTGTPGLPNPSCD